ncbi:MAG TPA: hypothetical protein VLA80_01660, partial [Actinomycetota bacterium]|nr:hypothetical protein [Actinomycetota bacterium]
MAPPAARPRPIHPIPGRATPSIIRPGWPAGPLDAPNGSRGSEATIGSTNSEPDSIRRPRSGPLRAIGAAFTDTPEGHEVRRVAADLAARAGLPLTVYSVVALHPDWLRPEAVQPDESVVPEEVRKAARDALDRVVAGLPGG